MVLSIGIKAAIPIPSDKPAKIVKIIRSFQLGILEISAILKQYKVNQSVNHNPNSFFIISISSVEGYFK